MSDAPEKIWFGPNEQDEGWGDLIVGKEVYWETPEISQPDDRDGLTEYIRADIARNEVLEEAAKKADAIADEWASSVECYEYQQPAHYIAVGIRALKT